MATLTTERFMRPNIKLDDGTVLELRATYNTVVNAVLPSMSP